MATDQLEATRVAPTAAAAGRGRSRAPDWLTLAACLGATLPVIASTIRGLAEGFVPNGDRAIIAVRAYDVLTSNTPLVGQYSASSLVTGHATHSPGPMLYWLLALPARLGGPRALALTMGLAGVAAVAGAVLLARRRGGPALMVATALALALMTRSLVPEIYHDIWNPSVGVLPLTLLAFMCWSIACGDEWLLPLAVVVASFAAQAELTFLLPSAGLLAVALAGAGLRPSGPRRRWRWYLAAAIAAAACWTAPLVDEAIHDPGNLTLIGRAALAHKAAMGIGVGWHALVRAIGVPPWWLRAPSDPFSRLADVRSTPPTDAVVSCVLLLCAVLALIAVALRRGRRDVAAAGAIALVLSAALAAVAAATPTREILMRSLGYTLWWGSPAGMWVWLTLAWGALTLRGGALPFAPRRVVAAAVSIAAMLAAGGAVAAAQGPDQDRVEYHPIRALLRDVRARLPRGARTVRIAGSASFTAFDFRAALLYDLRRRGLRPLMLGATRRIGAPYEACRRRDDGTLFVWDGPPPPGRGGHPLTRVRLPSAVDGVITVTFTPGQQQRLRCR